MDWDYAIEKHRNALLGVLAMLAAMAGMHGAGPVPTLPRHLHRAVLRLLRPAESAVRRLIVVVARGLVVAVAPHRDGGQWPALPVAGARTPGGGTPRVPSLPLCDPARAPFRLPSVPQNSLPRISVPGFTSRLAQVTPRATSPDDPLDAGRILSRLRVLHAALEDLPRQALRLARWRAGRRGREWRRRWPLRHGRPPGACKRRRNEVHAILEDLHGLAFEVLSTRADTS